MVVFYLKHDGIYFAGALAPRKSVSGWALPSAREVSAKTFTRLEVHPITSSYMAMVWGQFMDHDLDHTAVAKMLTDGKRLTQTFMLIHTTDMHSQITSSHYRRENAHRW